MILGNFGCGPDVKEGWINTDSKYSSQGVVLWDLTTEPQEQFIERFDFILVNHVLCTMDDYKAYRALVNIHRCLKENGTLQVIDMDLLKVFASYREGRIEDIPIDFGDIDDRLCEAISGYGTRNSLYTPTRMERVLESAGFRDVKYLDSSEYDLRPKESLVLEAIK